MLNQSAKRRSLVISFGAALLFTACVPNYYVQENPSFSPSNIPEDLVLSSSTYDPKREKTSPNKKESAEYFVPYTPLEMMMSEEDGDNFEGDFAEISVGNVQAERILSTAKTYLGTPYKYGGSTRKGIDCSAFVQKAFGPHEVKLPRVSREQAKKGMAISKNKIKKGDLVFFATQGGRTVSHVGIVVDNIDNHIRFIHASTSQGVTISDLDQAYWKKRYLMAKRVL